MESLGRVHLQGAAGGDGGENGRVGGQSAIEIAPSFVVKIRVAGGRLVAQAGEQPEVEPVPASDSEFYVLEGPVKIVFEKDAAGRVVSLKASQNGQQFAAKKLD